MGNIGLTLKFSDASSCSAFASEFEEKLDLNEIGSNKYSVSIHERKLHSDSEFVTLLLTFMKDGGLLALSSFLLLTRDILRRVVPEKKVMISNGKKAEAIDDSTPDEAIEEIAERLLSEE